MRRLLERRVMDEQGAAAPAAPAAANESVAS